MRVIDFTSLLTPSDNKRLNYYVLNPCVVHISDRVFVATFRVIYYKLPIRVSPWSKWYARSFRIQS